MHDDEEDYDDDYPDEEESESMMACPYCKRMIHEDSNRCNYCENYISAEDHPAERKSNWMIIGLILCMLAAIMMAFM